MCTVGRDKYLCTGILKVLLTTITDLQTLWRVLYNHMHINPFQPSDAIWHNTFNSVLHMLQFWGQKKIVAFFGMEWVNPLRPPKIVAYEGQN
jgi:hypothetical protein